MTTADLSALLQFYSFTSSLMSLLVLSDSGNFPSVLFPLIATDHAGVGLKIFNVASVVMEVVVVVAVAVAVVTGIVIHTCSVLQSRHNNMTHTT